MNKKKIEIWHVDLDGHYSGVGYVNTINEAKKIKKKIKQLQNDCFE